MATIIDMFMPTVADLTNLNFTVDNSVNFLNIGFNGLLEANEVVGKSLNGGDNFQVLSHGIVLPESYIFSYDGTITGLSHSKLAFSSSPLDPGFLDISMPFANYELSINNYIKNTGTPGTKQDIFFRSEINISMENVPDSENGKIYKIAPFVKIAHSEILI